MSDQIWCESDDVPGLAHVRTPGHGSALCGQSADLDLSRVDRASLSVAGYPATCEVCLRGAYGLDIPPSEVSAICDWARSPGYRPQGSRCFRDAVHEASHAVELGLPSWERETIHAAVMSLPDQDRVSSEALARATERLACIAAGLVYTDDVFMVITSIEAMRAGVTLSVAEWRSAVATADERGRHMLEQIRRGASC